MISGGGISKILEISRFFKFKLELLFKLVLFFLALLADQEAPLIPTPAAFRNWTGSQLA